MMHYRESIRLPGYDYTQRGAYFVTVCAYQRERLFGDIRNGVMGLNEVGCIVADIWHGLPQRFPMIELDEFVVMPNHIHGIIWIADIGASVDIIVGAGSTRPTPKGCPIPMDRPAQGAATRGAATAPLRRDSLGEMMAYWKYVSAKNIHLINPLFGPVWQRNYYERIIRNERELYATRQYIRNNPAQWGLDEENVSQ